MANQRARLMRQKMTPQEVKLWVHLRGFRRLGYHFRRQVPRGPYILDFACLGRGLVIEVDGSQHGSPVGLRRDAARDDYLAEAGLTVLRVWNNDVDLNLDGVLAAILDALERALPTRPLRGHPPRGGEG